jgi:hypothetical protein
VPAFVYPRSRDPRNAWFESMRHIQFPPDTAGTRGNLPVLWIGIIPVVRAQPHARILGVHFPSSQGEDAWSDPQWQYISLPLSSIFDTMPVFLHRSILGRSLSSCSRCICSRIIIVNLSLLVHHTEVRFLPSFSSLLSAVYIAPLPLSHRSILNSGCLSVHLKYCKSQIRRSARSVHSRSNSLTANPCRCSRNCEFIL